MAVLWTAHRFSGGVLALDTTNTVVHRGDKMRSFDRFADAEEIARFARAASEFREEELGGRPLVANDAAAIASNVLAIREATDRLFRGAGLNGEISTAHLSSFLRACADGLGACKEGLGSAGKPFGDPSTPLAFEAALAVSALSLLSGEYVRRLRICPNCNWLFLDRSRNGSRLWCDMTVCGNRQKAKRHYRRRKAVGEEMADV